MTKKVELTALRTQTGRGVKKGDPYQVPEAAAKREEDRGRGKRVEQPGPEKAAPAKAQGGKA